MVAKPSFGGSSAIFCSSTPNNANSVKRAIQYLIPMAAVGGSSFRLLCGQRIHLLPEYSLARDDQCYPIYPKKGLFRACSCHNYPVSGKCNSSVNDIIAVSVYRATFQYTFVFMKPAFIRRLLYPAKSIHQAIQTEYY